MFVYSFIKSFSGLQANNMISYVGELNGRNEQKK